MIKFLTLLALVGVCYCSSSDQYVDTLLRNVQNQVNLRHLERYPIANFNYAFRVGSTNYNAGYFNGNVTGISGVRRYGSCGPIRHVFNNVTMNCTLVIDRVAFNYHGVLTPQGRPASVETALIKLGPTYVNIATTSDKNRNYPALTNYLITKWGPFNPSFSGAGSKVVNHNTIGQNLAVHVSREFNTFFYTTYGYAFATAVQQTPMPMF